MKAVKIIVSGMLCSILFAGCISSTTGPPKPAANNVEAAVLNYQLGARYYDKGSYHLARDRLLLATELDPKNALAYSTLALTYEALDKLRLATESYEKAVRAAPRDFNVQNAYAVFLCRQKNYDKALKHFGIAINHPENDNSYVTMTNAGVCMTHRPDLARAESYFRDAIDKKADYGEALLQICLLKFQAKDYLSARAFLQRYMSGNVTTAGVLYLAARIEDLLNNDRGRVEYENQLLREFPTSSEARKVLDAR